MLASSSSGLPLHPVGESAPSLRPGHVDTIPIETPGGVFHVRLDPDAQVSQYGGLIPFLQFLQASGLLAAWEDDCPLRRTSPNASSLRALLGTWVAAVTAGQSRYAHITAVRGDRVIPQVLGCKRLVSEDTIRRGIGALMGEHLRADPEAQEAQRALSQAWVRRHLLGSVLPLLSEPWVLDIDVTIKPLYGYQEGSVVGHNPHKPGRPSHAIHSFLVGRLRLLLDAAMHPGDQHTSATTLGDLRTLLDDLPQSQQPSLVRADCGFGTEDMMTFCEGRGLDFLFKQRQTKRTRQMVHLVDTGGGWTDVGQGWQAVESTLELSTWTRPRRAVVLRRIARQRYPRRADIQKRNQPEQQTLAECQPLLVDDDYEYQVLVTSLTDELRVIAQLYRDRADSENVFDELKNQWGWGGFTSRSFLVSQMAARMVAQVYNWWSIFVRILSPTHHREAITARPVLLHSIARQTGSGGQRFLCITSTHRWKRRITDALTSVNAYFARFARNAEQLPWRERWGRLLTQIFQLARAPDSA